MHTAFITYIEIHIMPLTQSRCNLSKPTLKYEFFSVIFGTDPGLLIGYKNIGLNLSNTTEMYVLLDSN